ncbi:nitroreductase family deazaflavin-dependent oxidoreductase [Kribbella sp. NPDC051770]|uniref:nitroreductase family deazaflavin-dependent oxidoreductase n=1 Tax=Kribbella sp. NPDC051770 TaxID=3155413 RepID=UPI0034352995
MSDAPERIDDEMVIREFRAGRIGGGDSPFGLLLLHTVGARSGEPRMNPVGCIKEHGKILLWASNYGLTKHPAWYHNLKANPKVKVELPTGEAEMLAEEITDPAEYTAAWARVLELNPGVSGYPATAGDRQIPLIYLTPVQ